MIKVLDNLATEFGKTKISRILQAQEFNTFLFPFFMHGIGRTRSGLIRAHTVKTTHKDITKDNTIHPLGQQWKCDLETWLFFQSTDIQGNYRNFRMSGFFQGTADKANIVGSTAAAASLGHDNGSSG